MKLQCGLAASDDRMMSAKVTAQRLLLAQTQTGVIAFPDDCTQVPLCNAADGSGRVALTVPGAAYDI